MIKAVFFDAAGTLFNLPRGVGYHYRTVAERHDCFISEDALRRAFGTVWNAMPARASTRAPRIDDDKGWWRELVERVLDHCGVSAPDLDRDAYFAELYAEFTQPAVWELFPEARQVIKLLRPRFRLAVVSNFDGRLRPILANLGVDKFFEHTVISSEVGADKPDAWIFERALELIGVAAAEAMHVGDDPARDWQGAAAAGLHSFPLHRPQNSLRDLPAAIEAASGVRPTSRCVS
jgi:putative hydrolase of the HAD superfamily